MIEKNFQNRLKEFRAMRKISLSELSEMVGYSKSYVSDVENKRYQSVKSNFLEKIAKNTDVNLHWLITGRGPATYKPYDTYEVNENKEEYRTKGLKVDKNTLSLIKDIQNYVIRIPIVIHMEISNNLPPDAFDNLLEKLNYEISLINYNLTILEKSLKGEIKND